jgi:hypothetical protein
MPGQAASGINKFGDFSRESAQSSLIPINKPSPFTYPIAGQSIKPYNPALDRFSYYLHETICRLKKSAGNVNQKK